jgi:hypothetical protein
MRPLPRVFRLSASLLTAAAASLFASGSASAAGMDPTPERLVLQPPGLAPNTSCQSVAADPTQAPPGIQPGTLSCRPDHIAFKNMLSELGFAIAPTAFHPARTTGFGGFALTLEASYTHINADDFSKASDGTRTQYWHAGTQGAVDPNNKLNSIVNNGPDSLLQVYSLKARKGLPLGFEITGALGYIANTTLWVGGADIRWALLEGFRIPNALGYIPDVSVGGGVRTLTGTSKLFLTTVGIDVQVSKPITLADSAVLTPYIGYQRLIIFGNSTVIDATPNVDALARCGYGGIRRDTGAQVCTNNVPGTQTPDNGDFNNNITFNGFKTFRHRGIIGLNYRYEILYLATQLIFDLTSPNDEDPELNTTRQYTMSFEGGVYF